MTTAYYSTIANTFGHVAYDGDARINDALGTIIEQAPKGALARFRFKRAHNRPDRAQLHLGRAWQRLAAMSEALIAPSGEALKADRPASGSPGSVSHGPEAPVYAALERWLDARFPAA